jgi:SAM-dependent methyltransferase
MDEVEGSVSFRSGGDAYDDFMGRYSRVLAPSFVSFAGVRSGERALDVGCGTGALTSALVDVLGPDLVSACDPTPGFVDACRAALPEVDFLLGRAEGLPYETDEFDVALSQLVLHFVTDPESAASEFRRVVRPGGRVAACVWDFDREMEMLRLFWDAALTVDPAAPDEARTLRFGRSGEISVLLVDAGMDDVVETSLEASSTYGDFGELWNGFLAGVGPAGTYCTSLDADAQSAVREAFFESLGSPAGSFSLSAVARAACGRVPH